MSIYIKKKSDGTILHSCSTQTVENSDHLKACQDYVTSRGMSLSDFIIADATEDEIKVIIKDAQTSAEKAMEEIQRLEGQITIRRIREAYTDATWMNAQEALIAAERAKL